MADFPPMRRTRDEVSGEYRDSVSFSLLFAAGTVSLIFFGIAGKLWLAGDIPSPAVGIFMLIFPTFGLVVMYRALIVATLGFDRSGWRYRREVVGRTLETEQGNWGDIAQTSYRQWLVRGRNALTLHGEVSLLDSSARIVMKARTQFYTRGDPGADHAVGTRQIGLSEDDFSSFVSLINDETPQLPYEWVPAQVPEGSPGPQSFFARSGPDRYVQVARGETATETPADPLPTPF